MRTADGSVKPTHAAAAPGSPAFASPMPIPTWLEVGPGSIWQSATRSAYARSSIQRRRVTKASRK